MGTADRRRDPEPWFTQRRPPPSIGAWALTAWRVKTRRSHPLVPDGCVDLVWTADGRLTVCGTEDVGWDFSLPAGTSAVGLRLRPGRAPALLALPAQEISNQRVAAADVLGQCGRTTEERLADCRSDDERIAVLCTLVEDLAKGAVDLDRKALVAMRLLDRRPDANVSAAANLVELGERQLRRRIEAAFGFAPAVVRRIHRLQRFLALGRAAPGQTITALAHAAGYHDHQHLVRDAQAIGRAAPSALLGR